MIGTRVLKQLLFPASKHSLISGHPTIGVPKGVEILWTIVLGIKGIRNLLSWQLVFLFQLGSYAEFFLHTLLVLALYQTYIRYFPFLNTKYKISINYILESEKERGCREGEREKRIDYQYQYVGPCCVLVLDKCLKNTKLYPRYFSVIFHILVLFFLTNV